MSDVTAVVLSANAYDRKFDGVRVHLHQSRIVDSKDLQAARFDAVAGVETPYFFFLDDDDDLPENYSEVISKCLVAVKQTGAAYAHTDEIVRIRDGRTWHRKSGTYSQSWHLQSPLLIHHLVLFDTTKARTAIAQLPRGHYNPEFLLFWQAAKQGTVYVQEIGYIWNKRPDALHAKYETGQSWIRAKQWCYQNP